MRNQSTPLNLTTALRSRISMNPRQSPRHAYIGASEIGLCLRSVLAGKHTRPDLDAAAMGRMLAGRALENEVVQLVRTAYGTNLRDTGRVQREYVHPTLPFRAHPDGRISGEEGDGILEVKTAGASAFGRYQANGLPPHHVDQVQAQMGLSGLSWGLVVLVSRENLSELISLPVTFDPEHYRRLEARAGKAAPHLQDPSRLPEGEPERGFCFSCPFSAACPAFQALRETGGRGEVPEVVRLQLECQLEELTVLERQLEPLEARTADLRDQIRTALGTCLIDRVVLEGGIAQLVTTQRTSLDARALQRDEPDVYARYLTHTTCTSLRITTRGAVPCP